MIIGTKKAMKKQINAGRTKSGAHRRKVLSIEVSL